MSNITFPLNLNNIQARSNAETNFFGATYTAPANRLALVTITLCCSWTLAHYTSGGAGQVDVMSTFIKTYSFTEMLNPGQQLLLLQPSISGTITSVGSSNFTFSYQIDAVEKFTKTFAYTIGLDEKLHYSNSYTYSANELPK